MRGSFDAACLVRHLYFYKLNHNDKLSVFLQKNAPNKCCAFRKEHIFRLTMIVLFDHETQKGRCSEQFSNPAMSMSF